MGDGDLRAALFMPAMVAKNHNPDFAQWASALEARGKSKKAVVGACMRKLVHVAFGVLRTQTPYAYNLPKAA